MDLDKGYTMVSESLVVWITEQQARSLINDIGVAIQEGIGGDDSTDILVMQMVTFFDLEEPWWFQYRPK